jgi:esterase/lipase
MPVLQVNYRGSVGYGKRFLNAGNRQWGLKMHDDLIDAVEWAVKEGIAERTKVAITGGSYGGYATLAGLAFTPEVFALRRRHRRLALEHFEPSSGTIPPYWKPMKAMFDVRVGNIEDPKDEELVRNASPLHKADRIRRPLLIGQGANDPRVKQAESEQIVAAIEKSGGKVTYVVYPDEGHGFARPENRIDFQARGGAVPRRAIGGTLRGPWSPTPTRVRPRSCGSWGRPLAGDRRDSRGDRCGRPHSGMAGSPRRLGSGRFPAANWRSVNPVACQSPGRSPPSPGTSW